MHVRVTASPETYIRTLLAQGLNREAAARAIKRTDDERSAFVRFAFGVDWEGPDRYDLPRNVDELTVNLAVSNALHVVRSPEFSEASADAIQTLGKLALASGVEACCPAVMPAPSHHAASVSRPYS